MPRPRDGRCRRRFPDGRRCSRQLPPEQSRGDRLADTDVCGQCADALLALYFRSARGRAWLASWRDRLNDLQTLIREMGVESSLTS